MQEPTFTTFNSKDAWALGRSMVETCAEQGIKLGMEIFLYGRQVFLFMPDGLSCDKIDWLARKRNTVLYFGMSTSAMYTKCGGDENLLNTKYGLDTADYTLIAGSVPLRLEDGSIIGAATVTGLKPEEDHAFIATALQKYAAQA